MKPYYQDNAVTIYHGDSRQILPSLEPVDLVLTDPPYGINYQPQEWKSWNGERRIENEPIIGDENKFDPTFLFDLQCCLILWGANYYSDLLPTGNWLLWDKRCDEIKDKMFGSPVEMAWTCCGQKVEIKRLLHGGVINADSSHGNNKPRFHPTQKPLALMVWCLEKSDKKTILDPFMGSGTTLRAAKDLGRKAIGIEIEEKYCELAAKRMAQEVLELTA